MTKGKAVVGLVLALTLAVGAARWGAFGNPQELGEKYPPLKWVLGEQVAKSQGSGPRPVAVEVATAVKRKTPVQIEALGNVTTMASVAVKPRIDDEIVGIHFSDGAFVKKGDLLVTLDPRSLQAQISQAEAQIARDQAQLEMADRDMRRYIELVGKGATPLINVDNARTAGDTMRAAIRADNAAVENLKVQLSFCFIRAPISGRISQASVKVGNFARSADLVPIATINQIAPIYVTFMASQRNLPDIRVAMAEGEAAVEAVIPGESRTAAGRVSMIENAVDPTTGLVTVRATMPNDDELLWPGTLVTARLTLRTEEAIVVPSLAVQGSQQGNFVYVVKDNVAIVTPVQVARSLGAETVIESGLKEDDVVVTDGHLLLTDKARVTIRQNKAGA
jgi:membrane fusion protein, multidrug efflux system